MAFPFPVKWTICGFTIALSLIVTLALINPFTAGLNITEIAHEAPGARLAPHVFVSENSAALAPVSAMLEMVSVESPVFVIVAEWGALLMPISIVPRLRVVGTTVTLALGAMTVIVMWFELAGAATAEAVIVTMAFAGIARGAEYVIVAPLADFMVESVPHIGEQEAPFCVTVQVTPWLRASLLTVAVSWAVLPVATAVGTATSVTTIAGRPPPPLLQLLAITTKCTRAINDNRLFPALRSGSS